MRKIQYDSIEVKSLPFSLEIAYIKTLPKEEIFSKKRILYLLHGGGESHHFLEKICNLIFDLTDKKIIPPFLIVCPNAQRSQYMNYFDNSERWEDVLTSELPKYLYRKFGNEYNSNMISIFGSSMGGVGGLRLAFKHPKKFNCVAVSAPGIVPSINYSLDIHKEYNFFRTIADEEIIYGSPINKEYWKKNNPVFIAKQNSGEIQNYQLKIYLECGDHDSFGLFHGTSFLHRELNNLSIKHEYHLLHDIDHIGPYQNERIINALSFIGRMLKEDHLSPDVIGFREMAEKRRENFQLN